MACRDLRGRASYALCVTVATWHYDAIGTASSTVLVLGWGGFGEVLVEDVVELVEVVGECATACVPKARLSEHLSPA